MEFLPIILLLPVALYIFAKQDFTKIFFYKMRILTITLILILISPMALGVSFTAEGAMPDNTVMQIIKIVGTYPANVSEAFFNINPPIQDIDKTFVFLNFAYE